MTEHALKTWPESFGAVAYGIKRHEVRVNDRGFRVGDFLLLREFWPDVERFTGSAIRVRVTYLSAGGTWGLPAELCVMSIELCP
jgi:hypothetical protein